MIFHSCDITRVVFLTRTTWAIRFPFTNVILHGCMNDIPQLWHYQGGFPTPTIWAIRFPLYKCNIAWLHEWYSKLCCIIVCSLQMYWYHLYLLITWLNLTNRIRDSTISTMGNARMTFTSLQSISTWSLYNNEKIEDIYLTSHILFPHFLKLQTVQSKLIHRLIPLQKIWLDMNIRISAESQFCLITLAKCKPILDIFYQWLKHIIG